MSAPLLVRRDRALLHASGRDPVKMVDGLATADIQAVTPGQGAYTAFLTAKGKMVADARVFAFPAPPADNEAPPGGAAGAGGAGQLLLDVDPGAVDGLVSHLQGFVPPLFARFRDVSDEWSVHGVYGEGATAVALAGVRALGSPAGAESEPPHEGADGGALDDAAPDEAVPVRLVEPPVLVARTRLAGGAGWEFFTMADRSETLAAALRDAGAVPADAAELDRLRVLAGRPGWGAELTTDVIPLEAGLLDRAISQAKGCYTGQEVIVRILHRGHVNRHLRRLRMDPEAGGDLSPGTDLFQPDNDRPRGTVTSVVEAEGGVVGLGYVRREVEPPASLRAGSVEGPEVQIESLPA